MREMTKYGSNETIHSSGAATTGTLASTRRRALPSAGNRPDVFPLVRTSNVLTHWRLSESGT